MASRITGRKLFVCLMLIRLIINFPQAQPTVHEDDRIGFELHAPSAGKVLLNGLGDRVPIPMTRAEGGLWSVTAGPLEPDLHPRHSAQAARPYVCPAQPNACTYVHLT